MTTPTNDIKPDLLISHYGEEVSEEIWERWERAFDPIPPGCQRIHEYENREGMETLIADFSTIFDGDYDDPENYSTRIGRFSEATKQRIKKPSLYLLQILRVHLGEPEMTVQDAHRFLSRAELHFYRNPLWAWFTLDVFLQAGLPPPPWVWFYLLQIGEAVTMRGAGRLTRRAHAPSVQEFSDSKYRPVGRLLEKVFGIRMRRGLGSDLIENFAKDIERFRLALRVSNLLRATPNNAQNGERAVGEACKQVAATTGRDKRVIRTAYAKWFSDNYKKRKPRNSRVSRRAA